VLFVSHNMGAVLKLCQRAILLRAGRKVLDGSARDVVHAYLTAGLEDAAERHWSGTDAPGDETARLRRVSIRQNGQDATAHVDIRHPFDIQIEFDALRDFPEFNIQLFLHDDEGMTVLHTMQHLSPQEDISRVRAGRHVSVCHVPGGMLNAGHYWLALKADVPYVRWIWDADRVLRFAVENTDAGMARYPDGYFRGVIGPIHVSWEREGPPPPDGASLP
jgi:lipopolysaccharide transport system ATP-binding protein